jgi:peptide/nickel transport system permease protein
MDTGLHPVAGAWARRRALDPAGAAGAVIVAALLLAALLAPWIAPHHPDRIDVLNRFAGPSAAHWLGQDHLGRDLLSRLLHGARVALGVALSSVALALVCGTLLGLAAAFLPRRAERPILILFDSVAAFPSLVLALAAVAVLGPSLINVVVIVGVTLLPHFGRVARAQALSVRASPYLEAERILGASLPRQLFVHVVPNILGPLLVLAAMDVPIVIAIEAGLSFVGLGVRPPLASWGTLLYDGYATLSESALPVLVASLTLMLATLGFTLLGEALRDIADPRLQQAP